MTRLYLDAAAIIYAVEANPAFSAQTRQRIAEHLTDPEARLLTSRFSRLECRVLPLRENDQTLLADYEEFFAAERIELVNVSGAIIERATELRAQYGFKAGDAVHIATAIEYGAELVLTGDNAWTRCRDICVEVLVPTSPEEPPGTAQTP